MQGFVRWWRRFSIQNQIFFSMLSIAFVSILGIGNVAYYFSSRTIEENYTSSYEDTLKNSSRVMSIYVNSIVERIRTLLNDDGLKNALLYVSEKDNFKQDELVSLKAAAETVTKEEMWVNGVAIMDLSGRVYYLNNIDKGAYEFYDYYRENDYLEEEWAKEAKAQMGKEVFFPDDIMGSISKNSFYIGKYLMNPDTGKAMGYIVVSVSNKLLEKSFVYNNKGTENNEYLVVNRSGGNVPVYLGDSSLLDKNEVRKYLNDESQKDYLFLGVENSTTGWELMKVIDKNVLSMESRKVRNIVFAGGGATILFCFFVARLISRGITSPLKQLEKIIRRVGDGERHIKEEFDYSEVGLIGNQFKKMVNSNLELSERLLNAQLNEREAELLLLQAQINPHFLYNTLDSLYCMAMIKADDEIGDMVLALSNNFKLTLNNGEKFMTVSDAVLQIREYMKLQNMRYNNRFLLSIDIKREILSRKIITFILQPFVENAMYHGLEPKIGTGSIKIRGWQEVNNLMFSIWDDGVGVEDMAVLENGYGIRNVKERIKLNYGDAYGVTVESRKNKGTKVTIVVPVR